jgi:hypothetical protein
MSLLVALGIVWVAACSGGAGARRDGSRCSARDDP